MSDGINILTPGDMDDDLKNKLASGDAVTPKEQAMMHNAQVTAEKNELEAEAQAFNNIDALPYKDDAPICAYTNAAAGTPRETEFHDIVQMPAWAHGRCIGAACHNWRQTKLGGICGDVLPQLASGFQLGLISEEDIHKELERWGDTEAPAEPEKKLVDLS